MEIAGTTAGRGPYNRDDIERLRANINMSLSDRQEIAIRHTLRCMQRDATGMAFAFYEHIFHCGICKRSLLRFDPAFVDQAISLCEAAQRKDVDPDPTPDHIHVERPEADNDWETVNDDDDLKERKHLLDDDDSSITETSNEDSSAIFDYDNAYFDDGSSDLSDECECHDAHATVRSSYIHPPERQPLYCLVLADIYIQRSVHASDNSSDVTLRVPVDALQSERSIYEISGAHPLYYKQGLNINTQGCEEEMDGERDGARPVGDHGCKSVTSHDIWNVPLFILVLILTLVILMAILEVVMGWTF
ncbi:hypothetical protein AMS68_007397 [Peltaster fructicola]|uniref:Uncharacterized protein n=1 Tax=Peltaster fructicola TaxID=286661 RepID=A0A6H0Y5K6_9PEZI|nr:hypothetical protein AMS68_007397 [Peltaster fructicola]